jgi:hypothetical protein
LGKNDCLGDKIEMGAMLARRSYIPWTSSVDMSTDASKGKGWRRQVAEIMTAATKEVKEFVIWKPSGGQQQRALLVVPRTGEQVG